MLGREIREIEQVLPGEYELGAKNGRGVALHYSVRHRHALYARHGIVFATAANLHRQQAEKLWYRYAEALEERDDGSETDVHHFVDIDLRIPTTRKAWYHQLLSDAVLNRESVYGMHAALKMVYDQSHDDLGNLRDVRPMKLRAALKVAEEVRREIDDATLAAMEVARSADPEGPEEDWHLGDSCRTPYFLRDTCVNCKRPIGDHAWVKAMREQLATTP